jgi:ABC-type multidrug transport system fused ATPase/permease subunit
MTLEIPHGRTLALVGSTGAGKSTVAGLLLRFVEPDGGRVTVGGVALDQLDPSAWRARVAYVPQHPHLFHGSVAENLRLARPAATDDELEAAARAANAHAFVARLPRGYATQVGEGGARLSGGQRQRIALARAILKDAPMLVLDEPTAHLDQESQEAVLDALERLTRGRTVLLIAHRPEPIERADAVALIERGRVLGVREPVRLEGAP